MHFGTKMNSLDFEVKWTKVKIIARPDMIKKGTLTILKVMVQRSGSPTAFPVKVNGSLSRIIWFHLSFISSSLFVNCRAALMSIQDMDEDTLRAADMPFSTTSASGHVVPLTARVSRIAVDNRSEYVRLAVAYRSH